MKRPHIARLAPPALTLLMLGAAACNDTSNTTLETYGDDTSVAVTAFKLQTNTDVLARLDSVFFSIDLVNGVIFNADSLPKGTDVTGLIPVITYPETVTEAVITMTGGEKRSGEINYLKNPTDTVDFTGDVTLKLTAQDGTTSRTYRLKVNVHNLESDTLMWDELSSSALPSRLGQPTEQKSVSRGNTAWCLTREKDGSVTLASSDAPGKADWLKRTVSGLETADVRSFAASEDAFYILDADGSLLTSPDGGSWSDTGLDWKAITGGYGLDVLGIDSDNGILRHVSYPGTYPPVAVEKDFPTGGYSNLGIFENKWSSAPIAILAGGYDSEGTPLATVWGFDGSAWARISQDGTPALAEATLIPYSYFRPGNVSWAQTEYSVWLLLGGRTTDGELNRTVYMSYDNGVNWQAAVDYMQLPKSIPAMTGCDAVVLTEGHRSSLADNWLKRPARKLDPWHIKYEQDGYDISWEVPYIYLFGGYDAEGRLCDTIWRGVLNQLTFTPLI